MCFCYELICNNSHVGDHPIICTELIDHRDTQYGIERRLERARFREEFLRIRALGFSPPNLALRQMVQSLFRTHLERARKTRTRAFGTQRSLSAVHVAEHEYSRMADGRHFVSDERSGALLPRLSWRSAPCTMPRYYGSSFFFLSFFPSCEPLRRSDRPRKIRASRKASVADQVAKYCCLLFAVHPARTRWLAESAWKITEAPPRASGCQLQSAILASALKRDGIVAISWFLWNQPLSFRRIVQSFSAINGRVQITPSFFSSGRNSGQTRFLFPCDPSTWLSARNATRAILIWTFIPGILTL